ncbi:VOC family protein [Propionibacteriaceae bacterium Y1700]|uniref:VOC family protein n=1 Tax=Microlunatus sp. Y1700 TaxID=3418487 RepID=UPI003DA6D0ED
MEPSLRIELFPADLDVTVDFYRRLGFTLRGRQDGPPRYASMAYGTARFGFAESTPVPPDRRALPAGTEIVIDVDDVFQVHDQLLAADVRATEGLTQREWGLTDFRITDPDGYYLRFTERRAG